MNKILYQINGNKFIAEVGPGGNVSAADATIIWNQAEDGAIPSELLNEYENAANARENQEDLNRDSKLYLNSTDWYVIRWQETGTPVPQEILDARAIARAAIAD